MEDYTGLNKYPEMPAWYFFHSEEQSVETATAVRLQSQQGKFSSWDTSNIPWNTILILKLEFTTNIVILNY
jgi:hypothetical protein